ncbi:uncharacterized protein LOC133779535 [Humulus lupulus]|uniref:uncharacterized protein LOC133779535 n=1 Tax=Humulus lupulus TaxID=3486 RepID=UPI002B40846E|nr:uncharacterized protein LOC133779535 [Humulus lupulus]
MDGVRNAAHPKATADPDIQAQLDLLTQLGVRDDARCKIFPATLSETAQRWFFKLQPGSITSWDNFVHIFYSQFSSAMPLPAEPNDLVDINQRDNEPLKDYIQCFMQEATKVKSLSDDGNLIDINSGVKVKSLFWSSLKRKSAHTTQEFLNIAEEFIKLEEAERKVNNPTQAVFEKEKTSVGNNTNPVEGSKNGGKNGKRSKGAGSSGNQNDNKKPKTSEHPNPREYVPKFTTYTILLESRADVFNATQVVVPYKRPPPIRKDVNRRDMTKFYQFHNDYGHETNECNHLKEEIEFLIRKNNAHLKSMAPTGSIRLPLTVGTAPKSNTVMALFVVIDIPSLYNAMIGRATLYDL